MSPSFSNITSLSNYIKEVVKDINENEVSKKVKREYEKAIQDTVYRVPSDWQTGSFGNSVNTNSKRTKHTSTVSVFTDERLMTNSYPSVAQGYPEDNREHISWWIEKRHGGIWDVPGRGYFKLLMTEYFTQSKYKQFMVSELLKHGITAR